MGRHGFTTEKFRVLGCFGRLSTRSTSTSSPGEMGESEGKTLKLFFIVGYPKFEVKLLDDLMIQTHGVYCFPVSEGMTLGY